jgi:lipoprotein
MRKILIILAAITICGCQSNSVSYYQLDSYESIVKEIDNVVAKNLWIPTNYRNVEFIKDNQRGEVKLLSDFYFSKKEAISSGVFSVWGRTDIFADEVLIGRGMTLSNIDCNNDKNSLLKIMLQSFSFGKDKYTSKMIMTKQGDIFEIRSRMYLPDKVFDETKNYMREEDAEKLATPEMNQIHNKFRNVICSKL